MAYPQAKKCLYDGFWFKSNLEGKVAESLDKLGISWNYEPMVARGRQYVGGQYTPDFHLVESDVYIEVAGDWDSRHEHNSRELFSDLGCAAWDEFDRGGRPMIMHVDGNGGMHGIDESGERDVGVYELFVNRCRACGKVSIIPMAGFWACPYCGAYDGDHYTEFLGYNLFDAAGVKRYGGR